MILTRQDLFDVLAGPAFALTVITVKPRRRERRVSAANKSDPTHERYLNDFTPDAKAQALIDANRITKEVYEVINTNGEIFLTSGVIGGVYAIRVVAAGPMTEAKHLERAFEILVSTTEEVLAKEDGVEKDSV
jgi:aromatic-L-amino-acid decarboxylase